jgi:hypothetical protein
MKRRMGEEGKRSVGEWEKVRRGDIILNRLSMVALEPRHDLLRYKMIGEGPSLNFR